MNFDQKILIVRFSSIGDIVQSTSPLKTIRKVFPDSQITFITLNEYAPLLEMHPDIDFLISIKRNQNFNKLLELRNYLKSKKFNFIYDLHNSIRSNIITYKISEKSIALRNRVLQDFYYFSSMLISLRKHFLR